MATSKAKKEEILQKLKDTFKGSKSVIFGQYVGTNVEQITNLRRRARKSNIQIAVTKKTLIKLAAKENGYSDIPRDVLEGAVLAAFAQDEVSAAKLIKQFGKEVETVKLIGGLLEGKILDLQAVKELADMSSKEELLAKFIGILQSPLRSFAIGLNSPLSSFARGVKAYSEKQS